MRSRNPDLIFDDILLERAEKVARLYSEEGFRVYNHPLDRVTLFVTHRCNLMCQYCNGPHMNRDIDSCLKDEMLGAEMKLDLYKRLMTCWAEQGLKHIHFTGGECTLNKHLPDFVKIATGNSILSSITTNGTADYSFYEKLVNNGLSEIRISIDTTDAEEYDRITGVKGMFDTVRSNIAKLVKMKKENKKDIFIVLNACIGTFNISKIEETMTSLMRFGVDDIKLLVIAEQTRHICSMSSRKDIEKLLKISKTGKQRHDLLEKKIKRLFRKTTYGLADSTAQHEIVKCFIPITERTLDARGFFPCSIYLRYHEKPLVDIESSFDDQQLALNRFIEENDCREDIICRNYCTDCCKQFNLEVNRRIKYEISLKEARERKVRVIPGVKDQEVKKMLKEYLNIMNTILDRTVPYLVIKPLGMIHEKEIKDYLGEQGIIILNEYEINDWNEFALFLYFKGSIGEKARFKIARSKAYRIYETATRARVLILEQDVPEKKLLRIKKEVRNWYGEKLDFCRIKGKAVLIRENCMHTPNYKDLERDNKIIRYFVKNKQCKLEDSQ